MTTDWAHCATLHQILDRKPQLLDADVDVSRGSDHESAGVRRQDRLDRRIALKKLVQGLLYGVKAICDIGRRSATQQLNSTANQWHVCSSWQLDRQRVLQLLPPLGRPLHLSFLTANVHTPTMNGIIYYRWYSTLIKLIIYTKYPHRLNDVVYRGVQTKPCELPSPALVN